MNLLPVLTLECMAPNERGTIPNTRRKKDEKLLLMKKMDKYTCLRCDSFYEI